MIRLATDVGGTFTDLISYDEATGAVFFAKSLTTTQDQSIGVLDAIALAERSGLDPAHVGFFVHGGTTVINAITERKGVRTALVTTAGFRDVLEIGRGNRPDLYNLRARSPEPLVPRQLRLELAERINAKGEVLRALDEAEVLSVVQTCKTLAVEAIAIVFLHSYANTAHEEQCAAIFRRELPDVSVCASHEISRQWREYERTNTAVMNAYVQPIIKRYFGNLEAALGRKQLVGPYYAMQSNGGIASFDQVSQAPLTLVESGPSGGVAGAARIGDAIGETDLLYLDVGGTTAKCSLIRAGQPKVDSEYHLEKSRLFPGYTVQVPVVDIVEVGAGGGSIAWLDPSNRLRVGPQSAGSSPGPACYGRGGSEPTVTDAKLALGILDAENFAEGRLKLDIEASRRAIGRLALQLGMSIEIAALAIVRVAEEAMTNALKLITIQRGHDPRDLSLVVSGGAGPLLAASLGRELNVKRTVIPTHPGIFSAWGMLAASPRTDMRQTLFKTASAEHLPALRDNFAGLEASAIAYFADVDQSTLGFTRSVEMRYRGQEHSVPVPFDIEGAIDQLLGEFHRVHERTFSFSLRDSVAEITMLHLQTTVASNTIGIPELDMGSEHTVSGSIKGQRSVFLSAEQGWTPCTVHDRELIPPGTVIKGPALIEEPTTTTFILAHQTVCRDRFGQLSIRE